MTSPTRGAAQGSPIAQIHQRTGHRRATGAVAGSRAMDRQLAKHPTVAFHRDPGQGPARKGERRPRRGDQMGGSGAACDCAGDHRQGHDQRRLRRGTRDRTAHDRRPPARAWRGHGLVRRRRASKPRPRSCSASRPSRPLAPMVVIGHPADGAQSKSGGRKPLSELVSYDRYGPTPRRGVSGEFSASSVESARRRIDSS